MYQSITPPGSKFSTITAADQARKAIAAMGHAPPARSNLWGASALSTARQARHANKAGSQPTSMVKLPT